MQPTHSDFTIHRRHHHGSWDNSITPVLTVAPGATIEFETMDSLGGQLPPGTATAADVLAMDFDIVNPVTGPVRVDGAEPGDALKVTIREMQPSGYGWTLILPGFGLLTEDFTEAAVHNWKYDRDTLAPCAYNTLGKVPLKPMIGTIGLAPAAPGPHSVLPPTRVGGNMDIRDMNAGTELYLPVEVAGALFSVGDTHAAQGDGEVCGTAIESPMTVVLQFDLIKKAQLAFPQIRVSGPVTRHLDSHGYYVTTGIGSDLMQGAKDALRGMIDLLGKEHGVNADDAYMLCSVCGDLRISEIVDQPNWVVSFYFPRVVFA